MSSCCRTFALALGAAISFAAGAAAQEPAAREPAKPSKLFASDSVFAITIATDVKKYVGTRDSAAPWLPARLILGRDTLRVGIRPRGHFRRKTSTCSFPPVSVKFGDDVKGTLFAKQKKLKLVTTCRPGSAEFEAYIPQEYMLYRLYDLITPFSFRARLVRVTYADTAHPTRAPIATMAFFVEDQKDMAARNAGEPIAAKNGVRDDFEPAALAFLSLFQFMIANTDWSFGAEHNIRLVRTAQFGVVFPVPYDFDWAGVIGARYATPDRSLPIRTVRDRIWTSYCFTSEELAPAIAVFNAKRPAITALYTDSRLLDAETARASLEYLGRFYDIVNDPKQLAREIKRHCAG